MSERRSGDDYDDTDSNNSDAAGGPAVPRGAVGYSYSGHRNEDDPTAGTRTASGSGGRGRGWEGDDLERDRDREHRAGPNGFAGGTKKAAAAVDLEQFRNYQVGSGYQARHVVRQRTTASTEPQPVGSVVAGVGNRDSSGLTESATSALLGTARGMPSHKKAAGGDEEELRKSKASRKEKRKRKESVDKEEAEDDSVRAYLECDAFRVFRKELESMLQDS